MKQAVILAGGKGSRLRERLGNLPKPLVDVCGTPLLERQIHLLKRHGYTDVLILVNDRAEQIIGFCSERRNFGLRLSCIDDGKPRGTAGATLAIFDRLENDFLVLYGDTMLQVDLGRLYSTHISDADIGATILLHPNDHPDDSDLVEVDEHDYVTAFYPYPRENGFYRNLVNAGLYYVRKRAIEPWRGHQGALDFGKDLFPMMLRAGVRVRGYNSPEYIKDCGTPSRLDKVRHDVARGKLAAAASSGRAAVFIDRDGTINREVHHLRSPEQLELLPNADAAIRRLNLASYLCCVITNQPVVARGECTLGELRQIHNKLETVLGRGGAFIDRIYYCPHYPEAGFPGEVRELKTSCNCRKPNPGLIERACEELSVVRDQSWAVGDTTVDIETARRAGIRSMLVETGYAGLDYAHWNRPDITVPDLYAAVRFILDEYPRWLLRAQTIACTISPAAIVLVGGHSRSGKSNFASVLRDALLAQQKRAHVVPIDAWLRNEAEREPGVLGRYDMAPLQNTVDLLAHRDRPVTIDVPGYHKIRRERVGVAERLHIDVDDVVIVEGTVALALRTPDEIHAHRLHVEIAEPERRRRVLREYELRSYEKHDAEEIYLKRSADEFPVIENLATEAVRVCLDTAEDTAEHTVALECSDNK